MDGRSLLGTLAQAGERIRGKLFGLTSEVMSISGTPNIPK